MKFKVIAKDKIEIGELGVIVPGQVFEVHNETLLPLFMEETLFEEIKSKKVNKKVKDGE